MRVGHAISRKTAFSWRLIPTYKCKKDEKQNSGLARKRLFPVIHQEITGIKGMRLHRPAGGDELEPEAGRAQDEGVF